MRQRGIFEEIRGSGIWWICYFDEQGRRHREKVDPKKLAIAACQKRKTEVRERRFFPITSSAVLSPLQKLPTTRSNIRGRIKDQPPTTGIAG